MDIQKKICFSIVLSSLLFAETNTTIENGGGASTYKLDASVVNANAFAYQSGQEINSQTLKTIPNGNGDITSTLKMLPNVQFDNAQLRSTTPGEIDPANVSISGGLYYQNSFLLDGKSMNNDLRGVSSTDASSLSVADDPGNSRDATFGRSQGLNIDTFLLKSIKVQDSNVGASYGHFTGGVIEAETKRAEKDFGVNFAYQISQGNANPGAFSLTKYHLYEGDGCVIPGASNVCNYLNSSNSKIQPKFVKHSFRSSLESKINDKFGVIASFTTTQSFIPLKSYSQGDVNSQFQQSEKTQKRQNYNFFIKGSYQASDDVLIDTSYAYAPQFNTYFRENARNSDTTIISGGHQLGADLTINNSLGFASVNTSFSYLEESRRSESAHTKIWLYSAGDKDWALPDGTNNIFEGSFGDEDSKQSDLSLKLAQNFEPYYNDSFENGFNVGAEFSYTYSYFKRLKDSNDGLSPSQIFDETYACKAGDEWCSSTSTDGADFGQFITTMNKNEAGKVDLANTSFSFFLENESKFDLEDKGDISARVGVRGDYDTYMQKTPIAPRFSANYTAPWGKDEFRYNTSFTFGANRYYGRNLFAYRFAELQGALTTAYFRFNNVPWESLLDTEDPNNTFTDGFYAKSENRFDFKRIKIPYDDELMFGVVQEVGLFNVSSKYIHRFGRDQVRRSCLVPNARGGGNCDFYTYDNTGKSDTDVITLSIANTTPFMSGAMSNFLNFAFDYTNTKRSYNDYTSSYTGLADLEYVEYKGRLMKREDLPAENFAKPLTMRFSTTHSIRALRTNWTLNNFFRYRFAYTTRANTDTRKETIDGIQRDVDIYEDYRVRQAFTWDLRLGIEKAVYGKNTLYFNVDVFNVLDQENIAIAKTSKVSVPIYELGRQFWLEVGYRY
ncbi:TonB-dependent receptor [Campylobacter sp. MIT 99-7217]|uniref:TonB-dependent receptor plug domain-containing protein n=1 Tax=Campylobacter sp. MIT 99-7217 TaxID=535091 RepID=UPI00115869D3|nr:TonB-dependent receptor plug domain-containing protein [Campylobacter sp. MIT 99-7217]TQR33063.1 TonB-dependent receptor [Campylobacter sp. MIT 99-7217]